MKKTPAALRFPFAVLATVPFFCRAVDSINDPILTPAFLQTAVAADRLQNALGTLAVDAARAANGTLYPNGTPITGGFGGYHPALDNPFGNATTGCDSLEPELAPETGAPLSIREYLVQNIVVDRDTDQPIHTGGLAAYSPLSYNATLHTVRKPRPGDLIPYVGSTYTPDGAWNLGPGQHQRRFTIDFPVSATDAGVSYPVVLGIRDQSPTNNTANYNSLGEKDGLSFIALFPDYAAYVGSFAYGQEKYSFSYGPGIAHPDILGARRFARGSYPNPVPKLGSLWYANFLLKSYAISEEEMADSPDTRQGNLVPQFQAGKRILYSYGKRGQQTPPLDTIVVFAGLNRTNRLGDAPLVDNESTGCERIYLTREFGYACRWELWANENDKRVALTPSADSAGHYPGHPTAPALAVEWWQRNEGGLPADMSGNYTAHFRAGPVQEIILERDPVTNEPTAGYYTHTQTIINPDTGAEETLNWYLIGVHDMTDVHDLVAETGAPVDPFALAPLSADNPSDLKSFGFQNTANWTGATNNDFATASNWDAPVSSNTTLSIANATVSHTSAATPPLSVELAFAPAANATLSVTNATLAPSGSLILANGDASIASLSTANASIATTHAFAAMLPGSNASLILSNSTFSASYQFELARNGTAALHATDATLSIANLRVASKRYANASLSLLRSSFSAGPALTIAGNGSASVLLDNASITNATLSGPVLTIAAEKNASANLTLANASSVYSRDEITVADNGSAALALDASSFESRTTLYLGVNGTLSLAASNASLVSAIRDIHVAQNTNATLSLSNASRATTRNFTAAGSFLTTTNATTGATVVTPRAGNLSLHLASGASIICGNNITLAQTPLSAANVTLDAATLATTATTNATLLANGASRVLLATNGTLSLAASNASRVTANASLVIALNPGSNASVTLDSSTLAALHATHGNLTLARSGSLSLIASNNTRVSAANVLTLAADPAASANIALSGNSTLSAKSLVLGQGAVTFRLRPANTATPPLAAASLTTAAPAPVLILDLAGLAPPAGVSLVIPLLQTNTPTAAPVFDFRPLNLPKTHDASLAWSADAKTLSASLVPLFNPSDLPTDALLAYALTDAYVLGPDNLPSTNGSVAHLPKTTLSGGDLSLAFTPLRPECRYEVQRSLDLQTWETVATVPPSETEVSVSVPAASPRLFLRLKITPAK